MRKFLILNGKTARTASSILFKNRPRCDCGFIMFWHKWDGWLCPMCDVPDEE